MQPSASGRIATLPSLFDETEAAKILRVKPCTVRNERVRGKLGYTKIGKRIFYTVDQMNDYLQRQSVSPHLQTGEADQVTEFAHEGVAKTAGRKKAEPELCEKMIENERRAISALAQHVFKRKSQSPSKRPRTAD